MQKNLVIVESPAKAKTIEKFLGDDYKVMSSQGHVRDLNTKRFSIDIEHGFEPIYEIPDDKRHIVESLRKSAKTADTVWLASDEDREGEAISWHLSKVLNLEPARTRRIVFHEITKPAILRAIENPREIDINLVDAQQARRVLDRIVGFELSPVLWRKIKPGLSAGRVQSVAVRLIVDREKEIEEFKSEAYYRVTAVLLTADGEQINAELSRRLHTADEARQLLNDCIGASFAISDITVKEVKRSPAPPFTTSTLQQEANRKLGMSVAQTMQVAQRLYEAGHITYMRTDSLNLSTLAIADISKQIEAEMGKSYVRTRRYHTKSKGAQEAHEAIRPTYISRREAGATAQERRLYDLIWKRTVASQMSDAILERTTATIDISSRAEHFTAAGEMVKFDGFLHLYVESSDDAPADDIHLLPALTAGQQLTTENIQATLRFTQQPPRYSEASLVRKMEELGIGRPSTYAPTISTIIARQYVEKGESKGSKRSYDQLTLANGKITAKKLSETVGAEKGKLIPTDTGRVVNEFLVDYFPDIIDYNFTARVEQKFDDIADGKEQWNEEIAEFYKKFHPSVENTSSMHLDNKVGERVLGTDPATGKPVSVKIGRFGAVAQLGASTDEQKPQFASLKPSQSIFDITLDEALELFKLPRHLTDDITVAVGRFGPYVKHPGGYVSIPKEYDPLTITLDEATALIKAKEEADRNKIIATFAEEPTLQVLNGRFGPYITFNKKNYRIPKGTDAASLTLEECRDIIARQDAAPAKTTTRRGRRAATAKK